MLGIDTVYCPPPHPPPSTNMFCTSKIDWYTTIQSLYIPILILQQHIYTNMRNTHTHIQKHIQEQNTYTIILRFTATQYLYIPLLILKTTKYRYKHLHYIHAQTKPHTYTNLCTWNITRTNKQTLTQIHTYTLTNSL